MILGHLFLVRIQAQPSRPVSFFSQQGGTLGNGKNFQTVKADKNGIARVKFKFGPGIGDYTIVATSPESKGDMGWSFDCLRDDKIVDNWKKETQASINNSHIKAPVILKADGLLVVNPAYKKHKNKISQ
jgi:hypothetical protein